MRRPQLSDRTKRILQAVVSVTIVVGIFVFAFPQFADYGDVWGEVRAMTPLEAATLAAVAVWNLATYWFVLVAVMPGLTIRQAAVSNQASTAVANTLPGGGAIATGVTYAMYRSWGFTRSQFALAAVVSGVWNNFVKLGMPVLALALLALEGDITAPRVLAAVIGIGVLVGTIVAWGMFLYREAVARRIGSLVGSLVSRARGWFGKQPVSDWGAAGVRFRDEAVGLLHDRWLRLTASALLSHISLYIVLLVTLRHVGVGDSVLSWIEVLAVFAFIRLVSALPITPGGVGVVELGLTFGLQVAAGVDAFDSSIAAAVLVFRTITFALPIPLGAMSYVIWRRNTSWRRTPPESNDVDEAPGDHAEGGSTDDVEGKMGAHIDPQR